MTLVVPLEVGRVACADSIEAFLRAVDGLTEHELLASSRCHGWSRLEVVAHVIAGWQEMLAGFVCVVDAEPSVDAATYWSAVTRKTVEALLGAPVPTQWTDVEAALVGSGRLPAPEDGSHLAARLPAFG